MTTIRETVTHSDDGIDSFDFEWEPSTRTVKIQFRPHFWDPGHSRRLPASEDMPNPPTLREADIAWIERRLRQIAGAPPQGGYIPPAPTFEQAVPETASEEPGNASEEPAMAERMSE